MNDDSIRRQADAIFGEKVLRARKTAFSKKFRARGDVFEEMTAVSMAGIRQQNPDAEGAQVRAIFGERMRIARILNNGNIHRVV